MFSSHKEVEVNKKKKVPDFFEKCSENLEM